MTVPSQFPIGPCQLAFIGEAPGNDEEALKRPLTGPSGKLHDSLLRRAGIERLQCLTTNVLDFKLPHNSIKHICTDKGAEAELAKLCEDLSPERQALHQTPVEAGCYLPPAYTGQLDRLYAEIAQVRPNLVVALGATAVWATLGIAAAGKMKKLRGTLHWSDTLQCKVLPSYHPAYVLRNFDFYPIALADYRKAQRESGTPALHAIEPPILIPTTPAEVEHFLMELDSPAAVDIETLKGRIDNIGFADRTHGAMSVPIVRPDFTEYWEAEQDKAQVMEALAFYLRDPARVKIFQNGSYDVQWIWERWHIPTYGWLEDTRVLHHSLWPELPKDLGTISSLHLNLPAWKLSQGGRAEAKKEG